MPPAGDRRGVRGKGRMGRPGDRSRGRTGGQGHPGLVTPGWDDQFRFGKDSDHRGRRSMPIDLSVVGKRLEPTTHTYTERDVMLYALGVGADERQFIYERDLKVLPTFCVIPAFPAL